jgi:hypothetical protein
VLAVLVLVLAQEHVARGDLARLMRFSERVEIEIAQERGNLLAPAALRELQRWPGLATLELRLPVTRVEAAQLRKLKKFAARAARQRDASLKLLAPALIRVQPLRPMSGALIGCGPARAADDTAWLPLGIDDCALKWIASHLEPQPDAPRK